MRHRDASRLGRRVNRQRRWLWLIPALLLTTALGSKGGASALGGGAAEPARLAQATGPQTDQPVTLRGTVVSLDGTQLRIASPTGAEVVRLVPPLAVIGATRASLADIGPGTYLGTAAKAQPDGTFRALEVHIFAESMPPDAPIVRFGPGDASLLVPGASVAVFRAQRAADGTLSASRLTVGVDGTRLPM